MAKITLENLKVWRDNSLAVARDLHLLEVPVLDRLAEVPLVVRGSRLNIYNLYGHVNYEPDRKVYVYERNLAQFFPDYLREALNQSGMDHELIGHLGFYLSKKEHEEKTACVIQARMAHERGKEDLTWSILAKLLPYFMRLHRQVKLDAYSGTTLINLLQQKISYD